MASPDHADLIGWTAFMHACSAGNLPAAQALHALGASDARVDCSGRAALHLAVEAGWVDVVRWLLQLPGLRDRDGRLRDRRGDTPLDIARRLGSRALVHLLCDIG
jgi:ankyrin repeat protein